MDVTPIIPAGRQVIERYGPSGFRVTGISFASSVLVFPDRTSAWEVTAIGDLTAESLRPVIEHGGVEILLLGCGSRMAPVSPGLRQTLRAAGIVVDAMDTGAACRTYNVLMAEERRVAAALIRIA
ncbi:MAG TPA: Mth938-like domain-containing protein [Stellaceae bacterium]|nr:Mth938-like domain-containing protein [Stellaceae bacterium]